MNHFDTHIDPNNVFARIQEMAEAYANHSEEGRYELLAMLDKDKDLIAAAIHEAAREVYTLARKFVVQFSADSSGVAMSFAMPSAAIVNQIELEARITDFIARRALAEWIKLTDNAQAEKEHNQADNTLEDLKSMLYFRARPNYQSPVSK